METCTQRECHVKMKADWGDASTSHGMPNVASKPPDAGTHSPSQPSEGTNSANTLISGRWSPELRDNAFLLFKRPGWWYFSSSPSKHIQWGRCLPLFFEHSAVSPCADS